MSLRRALLDARTHAQNLGHTLTPFGRAEPFVGALYATATCRHCGGTITARASLVETYCYGSAADVSCSARIASLAALGRTFDGADFPRIGSTPPTSTAQQPESIPSPWSLPYAHP